MDDELTVEQVDQKYATYLSTCRPGTRLFYDKTDPEYYWQLPGAMNGPDGDFCHRTNGYIEPSGYSIRELEQSNYGTIVEVFAWDPDLLVDEGL